MTGPVFPSPNGLQLHALEPLERLPDRVDLLVAALVLALDGLELGPEGLQAGEMILNCDLHRLDFFNEQIELGVDGDWFSSGG